MHGLARATIGRVLQSLVRAEIGVHRGRCGRPTVELPSGAWPESLRLDGARPSLGCDSLERMWLASAINEMFQLHEIAGEDNLIAARTWGAWIDAVERGIRSGTRGVTFATSGSTGVPKRCAHGWAELAVEIEGLAELFADRARVAAAVPAHHIYGFLFTAMLPGRLGLPVIDAEPLGAGTLARELRAGDLLVAFPERWRYLDRSLPAVPAGVVGTSSAAPCPRWLIASLVGKGLASMVEIYGSSETAGIGTRRWPADTYSLMPHWHRGPGEDAPLVTSSGRRADLMDRLAFDAPRTFTVEGRIDGVVQVGGVNVLPGAVADRLRRHPAVRDAAVRPMRPEEGTRLKAYVVLAPDAGEAVRADIDRWLEEAFPIAAERPKAVTFGTALPIGGLGKLADW